jgi:two-component system, sensor histidine kinase
MPPLAQRCPDPARGAAAEPDLATFFAVSLDLLVIRDSNYRIVKVNPAWETTLGYSMDELVGRPMLDFIHPDDAPGTWAEMERVRAEPEVKGFINRYRCRDGGYRHLEWRARREGDLVYGVARDVTERLALDAEMVSARAAAEAANRAKSDFLANMSHEIRTPLNGVIGIATALDQTELTVAQREMVAMILSSGNTLERVVSDVLDFSKIEAGRLQIEAAPFQLRAGIQGLVEMFRRSAEDKGLSLPARYGDGADGAFVGDLVRIRQVLGNLLSNAVKFTRQGEVRLTVDVADAGELAQLQFTVEDTGIGFDQAFAGVLFQRFTQADGSITRRFGGTGLGLSISQALVEMMGGEITAASTPGQGSRFTVRLPLAKAEMDIPAPLVASAPGIAGLMGAQVLLAEDHPINQRVVELILEPFGVVLTKVEDGAQAVSAFADRTFDLVLMDMQMPVMDGIAATRAIRELETSAQSARRTPIIMLSANALRQHREASRAAGADSHLAKPVTAKDMVAAVSRALEAG